MTGLTTTRLIAEREISERIHSRVLRISTVVLAVLVVGGVILPSLIHSTGPAKPVPVGLVGTAARSLGPALTQVAASTGAKVTPVAIDSDAEARRQLKAGDISVAVIVGPQGARAEVTQSLSATGRSLLSTTLFVVHQRQVLGRAGVPTATISASQASVPLSVVAIAPPPSNQTARDIAALAVALLLYLAVAIYGGAVATGVAQEKTSRTAEVLLAAVRPDQLLAGKVIGIGLCGLGQLAVPAIAGLVANALVHSADIPSTIWVLLPVGLLWFALGYALYSFAFAAAGAMVARQEEVQFVTTPLAFPLVFGYVLVYALIASPHATWLQVLSFLPPLAPSLMPARVALGAIAWWETPVAVVIMLVSIYLVIRLASGIYTGGLVRSGERLSWGAALRMRRQASGVG